MGRKSRRVKLAVSLLGSPEVSFDAEGILGGIRRGDVCLKELMVGENEYQTGSTTHCQMGWTLT